MHSGTLKPKTSFTDLPAEIKNMIYKLSVESCHPAIIDMDTFEDIQHRNDKNAELFVAGCIRDKAPSLLRTCWTILGDMVRMCTTMVIIRIKYASKLKLALELRVRSASVAMYLGLIRKIELDGSSWASFCGDDNTDSIDDIFHRLTSVFPRMEQLSILLDTRMMSSLSLIKCCVWNLDPAHLQKVTMVYKAKKEVTMEEVLTDTPEYRWRALRGQELRYGRRRRAQPERFSDYDLYRLGLQLFSTLNCFSYFWQSWVQQYRLRAASESCARILAFQRKVERRTPRIPLRLAAAWPPT
ncbi:hypothetical protein Q7P37_007847 [Cladosporium fusiforme]